MLAEQSKSAPTCPAQLPVLQAEVNPYILRDDAGQVRRRRAEESWGSGYHEERPSGKQD